MSRLLNGVLYKHWMLWFYFALVFIVEIGFLATQRVASGFNNESFIYFSIGSYLVLVFFFSDLLFRHLFKNLILVKILVTLVMVAQLLFNTFVYLNNEFSFFVIKRVHGWYNTGFTFSVLSLLFLFLFITLIPVLLTYWHKILGKYSHVITGKKNAYNVFIEYLVNNIRFSYFGYVLIYCSLYELVSTGVLTNFILFIIFTSSLAYLVAIIFWGVFFYYIIMFVCVFSRAKMFGLELFSSESEFVRKYHGRYLLWMLPVLIVYGVSLLILIFSDFDHSYNIFYRLYFFIPAVLYFVMAVLVDRAAFIRLWRGRGDVKLDTVVSENP